MEPRPRYNAIKTGDIDLVDAYSTDSELRQYNLFVLEDDKNLFPPYQGAPLVRKETVKKYPEIKTALNKLSGKITDDQMRENDRHSYFNKSYFGHNNSDNKFEVIPCQLIVYAPLDRQVMIVKFSLN
jgi:predicted transcriptional regulator